MSGPVAGQPVLRQRVPGAQLPTDVSPAAPVPTPGPAEAAAAQALVEDFEAGVRRALDQDVAPPLPAEAGGPPVRPVSPAPGIDDSPARSPSMRPATILSRRVPGATLDPTPAGRPSQSAANQRPADPNEARDLVEQFEAGIARALREVRSTHQHEEGSR
jgi:hypothetical protein